MPQATADTLSSPCLRFRSSMVTLTTLELLHFDPKIFSQDLSEKIQQAPEFFKNLPMTLSLEKFDGDHKTVDLSLLRQFCTDQYIQLIGIHTNQAKDKLAAEAAGLAVLQPSRQRSSSKTEQDNNHSTAKPKPKSTEPNSNRNQNNAAHYGTPKTISKADSPNNNSHSNRHGTVHPETLPGSAPNKIVQVPVRSGQQVYAPGGDLIVLAPVSAGAEILADGNIHVYAPLRGRALAGVRGNTEAIIFCQSLEAELISVAGEYKISEDLQEAFWKKPAKIMLKNERLAIENL